MTYLEKSLCSADAALDFKGQHTTARPLEQALRKTMEGRACQARVVHRLHLCKHPCSICYFLFLILISLACPVIQAALCTALQYRADCFPPFPVFAPPPPNLSEA